MRKTLAAIVAVALLAAACSSTEDEEVATVGEVSIPMSAVTDLVDVEDSIPIDDQFREVLFRVVALEALEQALLADFDATVDDNAVEEQYTEFMAEIEEAGMDPAAATGIPNAGDGMIRFNARLFVMRDEVLANLASDPEVVQGIVEDPLAITTVCVRHVLVETEEEALDVKERLDGGEDLAEVAAEVSLDTGTPGGDLGCSSAGRFVEPFALAAVEAPIGEFTDPVESDFGFHVLIVDERTAPTAEEITSDPLTYLPDSVAGDLWSAWFNDSLRSAVVVVNPRYGTWSTTSLGIVPPGEE